MPRIAYFGPQGTFTEQAALRFGSDLVPVETIPLAVAAVRSGETEFACVPIENSVEGAVPATLDVLIRDTPVVAVAETVLDVRFSVLVRPGTTSIRTIASHPHALAQVREWIAATLPGTTSIATSSTAAAAAAVERGEFDAAVTAPVAINHYSSLHEYAVGVLDVADARTRFLLLSLPGTLPAPTGADRTSVVVTTPNRVGVLAELLTELALRGINLTGLESRPQKGKLGTYRFYIEVEGHIAEPRIGDALAALHRHSREIRFLGSFPKADNEPVEAHNDEFAAAAAWVDAVRKGERG